MKVFVVGILVLLALDILAILYFLAIGQVPQRTPGSMAGNAVINLSWLILGIIVYCKEAR